MRDKIVSLQAVLYLLNKTGPILMSEFEALLYLANKRCFFEYGQCVTRQRFSLKTFSPHYEKAYVSSLRHPDFRDSVLIDGFHVIALVEPDMNELSNASVRCMDYALLQSKIHGSQWLAWESWKPTEAEQAALDCYNSPEMQEIRQEFETLCKEAYEAMPTREDYPHLSGLHYHIYDSVCPDNADSDDDWFWAFSDPDNKETLKRLAQEYRREIEMFREQIRLEERFESSFKERSSILGDLKSDFFEKGNHFDDGQS